MGAYEWQIAAHIGLRGLKLALPEFLANIIIWGCGHAKVGVVVQTLHVRGLQPFPLTLKKLPIAG